METALAASVAERLPFLPGHLGQPFATPKKGTLFIVTQPNCRDADRSQLDELNADAQ